MVDQGTGNEPPVPQWSPPEAPSTPVVGPPPAPPGTAPAWGPPTWSQGAPPADPPPSGGRAWWPWVLGAVGIVAVFGVVAVLVSSGDDEGDTDEGGQAVATDGGDGDIFEDPQEQYTIELHPDWEQGQDVIAGVESFPVARTGGRLRPQPEHRRRQGRPGRIDEEGTSKPAPTTRTPSPGPRSSTVASWRQRRPDRGFIEYTPTSGRPRPPVPRHRRRGRRPIGDRHVHRPPRPLRRAAGRGRALHAHRPGPAELRPGRAARTGRRAPRLHQRRAQEVDQLGLGRLADPVLPLVGVDVEGRRGGAGRRGRWPAQNGSRSPGRTAGG